MSERTRPKVNSFFDRLVGDYTLDLVENLSPDNQNKINQVNSKKQLMCVSVRVRMSVTPFFLNFLTTLTPFHSRRLFILSLWFQSEVTVPSDRWTRSGQGGESLSSWTVPVDARRLVHGASPFLSRDRSPRRREECR